MTTREQGLRLYRARRAGRHAAVAAFTGAFLAACCATAAKAAAPPLRAVIDELSKARTFEQAVISPDGRQVAWVENLLGRAGAAGTPEAPEAPEDNRAIFLAHLSAGALSGAPRRLTAAAGRWVHEEHAVAWSPDSRRIAFLSDAGKPGQLQLYVASVPGPAGEGSADGSPRRLTHVQGFLASPAWSPDGRTVAVLLTEHATRKAGPIEAETPETGEIVEAATEQRLALVDVATGSLRQISPPDMYVYEYDWSPDGRRFAVLAAHGNGDNNWYVAQLYLLPREAPAGGAMTPLFKPPLQIACPRWSPDGRRIAFIAGLMSDEGAVGNDIFTLEATGSGLRNLTPGMRASAAWLAWRPAGKELLFAEYVNGLSGVATVAADGGEIRTLWSGPERASADDHGLTLSLAADGKTTSVIRSSFSRPPEVWAGPVGSWRQVSARNAGRVPLWGEAKSIHWSSDRLSIQGWLLAPPAAAPSAPGRPAASASSPRSAVAPGRKYPLIVNVHGGPASMALSRWPRSSDRAAVLAALGYYVLFPNPRGSFGWGEQFVRANVKDFGYGDYRDILAGVEAATRLGPIDGSRVGITGWSYGGYMSMWAVTRTQRFKAAVIGAGLANFQSYYGENKIDQWMIPYFGASVYDDPAVYARSSPITFVKQVKTPSLILVGERDGECPAPQSYEFWHALKTLGVETRLVVYAGEGHGFRQPAHIRDLAERTVDWFDRHLK